MRTLDQVINEANNAQGDARAKIVRLNWMVDDLRTCPLAKPIVVDQNWTTIVGDTRLIAVDILGWPTVPVLAQLTEKDGQLIETPEELEKHTGLSGTILTAPDGADFFRDPVEWVEFSIDSADHHMHDETQRQHMIDRYLAAQPRDFRFDIAWCQSKIDWRQWAT